MDGFSGKTEKKLTNEDSKEKFNDLTNNNLDGGKQESTKSIKKSQINKKKTDKSENNEDNDNSVAKSLLKTFDERVSNEKERLKQKAYMEFQIDKLINKGKEIEFDIENLDQTIQKILDKHHRDYVSTFSNFMDSVRLDLKMKVEQMEKVEEEKRKINVISE